ncbi:hypothetical protein EDC19_0009 [Natranaerovirga hydrolytica]|uniref:DUF4129 domain-containing protein n=1 Tax=Natranaerovirga hydrolytica TaxID=680378 RepID=A0A4R1N1L6_9FIRM|nr:hypothetical protein [Natranaerovirga hydrolytica]TCL00029.1 hypothetical protein EDC19_0009 [Natranaerovirga hydrolytica]
MKLFLKSALQGLVEIILFLPVLVIIGINMVSTDYIFVWLLNLLLFYILGITTKLIMRRKNKYTYVLIGFIVALVFNQIFYQQIHLLINLINTLLFIFCYDRGVKFVDNTWEYSLPSYLYALSIILYTIFVFFYYNTEGLRNYFEMIQIAGVIALIVSLLRINYLEVKNVASEENQIRKIPKSYTRNNLLFATIGVIIIISITSFNYIRSFIYWTMTTLGHFLVYIFSFFADILSTHSRDRILYEEIEYGNEALYTQNVVDRIINIILTLLAYISLIITVIVFVRIIYLGIKKLIKETIKLIKLLKSKQDETYLYEEEKEQMVTFENIKEKYKEDIKNWLEKKLIKEPRWEDFQTNQEKIRFLYQAMLLNQMRKGYKHQPNLTPNETCNELIIRKMDDVSHQLIEAYNKARYSNKAISYEVIQEERKKIFP